MTKSELQQYFQLKKEIKELEEEIETLKNQREDGGSTCFDNVGGGKSNKISRPTERIALLNIRISDNMVILVEKKIKAMEKLEAIENAIDSLNVMERNLMRFRYIKGLKWEEICVELNYSFAEIHRRHSTILIKLKDESK